MHTAQRLFEFQIATDTAKEAAQFMKDVEAFDVSIEEVWYSFTDVVASNIAAVLELLSTSLS